MTITPADTSPILTHIDRLDTIDRKTEVIYNRVTVELFETERKLRDLGSTDIDELQGAILRLKTRRAELAAKLGREF
jgi:hypothetical protein